MSTKQDFLRAASICQALDPDVRTIAIDAFCDYFRAASPHFDVSRFELAAREGVTTSASALRKNREAL